MGNFNRDRGGRSNYRRDGGRPEMYRAICDECGQSCEVPFKPTGNKPIFCSSCFENKGGSSSRRSNDRDFSRSSHRDRNRDRKMYSAVCAECGDDCEIPFKPTSDKPVFCSNCFAKREGQADNNKGRGFRSDNRSNTFEKQLQVINEKLDQILKSLGSVPVKKAAKKVVKKVVAVKAKTKVAKKITKKSTAKKVTVKKKVAAKKPVKKAVKKKTIKKKKK
ncbi:hypothetical protein K8R66_02140 [bacterium]|nr:hypothetical protein [bacterium]